MDDALRDEIDTFFSTAWEQIANESPRKVSQRDRSPHGSTDVYFTLHFHHCAAEYGLGENDAVDVYQYGESVEEGQMVREYADCEVGITYFLDPQTSRVVVASIWKQGI